MLRITQSANVDAAIGYYTKGLSQSDYYTDGKTPSYWGGLGADRLNLSGEVTDQQFKSLALNQDPKTGEKLKPRFRRDMRVGYDFTFNATKSISMALELSNDESVKKDIMDAWHKALNNTMKEVEQGMQYRKHYGFGGKFTKDVETGNMTWASFTHNRSRPVHGVPQMHLHQHVYVFNQTYVEEKGRFMAGQFGQIKKDAPYYEAVFHNHLAKALVDHGFAITRNQGKVELKGISREGVERFSARTQQIQDFIEKNQITSPALKAQIGAITRDLKSEQVLSNEQVKEVWNAMLSDHDRKAIDNLRNDGGGVPPMSAKRALAYALEHELETKSVINEKRLLTTALKQGLGSMSVEELRSEYKAQHVLTAKDKQGQMIATTRQVLAEERSMISHAKDHRGYFHPLTKVAYDIPNWMNSDQKKAITHIWQSTDAVTIVEGRAGTGKTTLMQTVVKGLEKEEKRVFALAPTNDAVDVLKNDQFKDTHTMQRFLVDKELQEQAKGKIVWLDEAGMVGTRDMSKLFAIARQRHIRVILTGDTRQHAAVQRGDALRLLVERGGMQVAEVGEIQRQKRLSYKRAVEWLSQHKLKPAFKELEQSEAIKEVRKEHLPDVLAADYVKSVKSGLSTMVVTPTNREKEQVTGAIRDALKQERIIKGNERSFTRHHKQQLTVAQKQDASRYEKGQRIQLNQNIKGFTKGETVRTLGTIRNSHLWVQKQNGDLDWLPLKQAERFDLYTKDSIKLAIGDTIRATRGGTSRVGAIETQLRNGARHTVAAFTDDGHIVTDKGLVIHKRFGNIDYGVVTTSHSSQGATVDKVMVANSSESFGQATNLKQFYVSTSRGKHQVAIYTDDKKQLLEQASKAGDRQSATELLEKRHNLWHASVERTIELYKRTVAFQDQSARNDRGMSPSRG